uniref:VPS33B late endosome and lysosome associated n=2 Tax=Oncorhynchus kisutch TaxID=8019 RepID=A0A8C7L207_ONCKI
MRVLFKLVLLSQVGWQSFDHFMTACHGARPGVMVVFNLAAAVTMSAWCSETECVDCRLGLLSAPLMDLPQVTREVNGWAGVSLCSTSGPMAHSVRRDAPELPDFSLLKRLARDQLIYLLEQLPGRKDLFIEADLMSPLDRIANVTTLKQHDVDKLYKVEHKPIVSTSDQLCFLIRPRIKTVKWICDVVNADKAFGRFRRYKIIFSPQKFYACENLLEEQGIFGDVTTDEWSFYLLPLDDDIISLELPEFFRDYFLEGDQRWVRTAGSALHLLHSVYGPFSKVYGIGRCSKMAYESWREQVEEGEQRARQAEIGNVFLIDRDVDLVTPLCSQVVYEGLVDDIFRIKCGCVEFCPDVTSSDKSIKVMLNSQDKVFNEIRNEHFSQVFGFLSQKARNLQTAYDKRSGMDIKQMKTFVSEELKGLKQEHRLLSLHIGASESMMKKKTKQDFQELLKTEHSLLEGFEIRECISYIEEHINRQVSMVESMRLLCLLSLTENGLLPKDYRSLKNQFLQSYGIEHLLTFSNLKQLGLLVEQQPGETLTVMESRVGKLVNDKTAGKLTDAFSSLAKKSNFRALGRRLNLVPKSDEEYDLRVPRDMAYIFSGAYIPLSCKLIEQVLERDGWTGLEEVTRMLNGHEFAVTAGSNGSDARVKTDSQRIILVMFLGGCTFSEISALRFLGREKGLKFIVVTTAITNSARLLESMLDNHA